MGRGRARRGASRAAAAAALGVLALLAVGCGSESHPNEARPQVPTRVAVTIGPKGLIVQPEKIAFGPEENQQIPQNQNHPQPPIKTRKPLTVVLVAGNQTGKDTKLELHGPVDASSRTIPARSPATMQTDLPTGTYTVAASGVGGPAKLVVGPYRASSKNDLLLP